MRKTLSYLWMVLVASTAAWGVERFPPPDFTSGYKIPKTTTPFPRAELLAYLDVFALVIALSAAAYLIFRKRSRRGIVILSAFSIAYFGFYRKGCVCPIGAIQNVTLSITDHSYVLPMVVAAFFLLPLAFALFFGRSFCSGVCPLGAVQEVALISPKRVPSWLAHSLGLIPWFYLGAGVLYAATGSLFLICKYDPFIGFFRLGGSVGTLGFGIAMLAIGLCIGRPYCRFMCPYGAILRILSPLSKWQVSVTPDECINCRLCENSCPYGAIRRPVTPTTRPSLEGKKRLAALIMLLPVIVALTGWLGFMSRNHLARLNPTVVLAERVWQEKHNQVKGTTAASEAFYKLREAPELLYKRAIPIHDKFRTGSTIFGAWVGLVIGLKLISLSVRRKQTEYQADASACVACGRCYSSCPVERAKQGNPEATKLLEKYRNG